MPSTPWSLEHAARIQPERRRRKVCNVVLGVTTTRVSPTPALSWLGRATAVGAVVRESGAHVVEEEVGVECHVHVRKLRDRMRSGREAGHVAGCTTDLIEERSTVIDLRIHAENRQDAFGTGLAALDLNMDGIDDFILGASNATALGRPLAGKVYVLGGVGWTTGVSTHAAAGIVLGQNTPNPFNPTTRLPLSLSKDSDVHVVIYDVHGRTIRELIRRRLTQGRYVLSWDGTDVRGNPVVSGVYFCRASAGSQSVVRKLTLIK